MPVAAVEQRDVLGARRPLGRIGPGGRVERFPDFFQLTDHPPPGLGPEVEVKVFETVFPVPWAATAYRWSGAMPLATTTYSFFA